jgi:hypothetical protein
MPRKFDTAVVTIGIDPGKNTLHLVGLDARGEIVLREKVAQVAFSAIRWLVVSQQLLSFIVKGDRTVTDDIYRNVAEALFTESARLRARRPRRSA